MFLDPSRITTDNPFILFGIIPGVEVDWPTVEAVYTKLMTNFHPDRYIDQCEPLRYEAQLSCAKIHHYKQILTNTIERLKVLLLLSGCPIPDPNQTVQDAVWLEAMLDLADPTQDQSPCDQDDLAQSLLQDFQKAYLTKNNAQMLALYQKICFVNRVQKNR